MQTVCILSKDEIFADAIRLELSADSIAVCVWAGHGVLPKADTYIWDMDTCEDRPEVNGQVIPTAWNREKPADFTGIWLDRPFRPARLRAVLGLYGPPHPNSTPYPQHSRRTVLLGSEEIKLTAVEFRLFCCLFDAKGQYISREDLHQAVWNGEGDVGIVNVYIHYLRQKLEKNGQKLFHSARGRGYAYFEKGRENRCYD